MCCVEVVWHSEVPLFSNAEVRHVASCFLASLLRCTAAAAAVSAAAAAAAAAVG